MRISPRLAAVVFYGALTVLAVLIVSRLLGELIPEGIASHVSRNSEGIVALVVLSAWIGWLRNHPGAVSWATTVAVAAALVVIAVLMLVVETTSTVRTLNEPAFAVALLVVYCRIPRPLPAWGWALPAGAALLAVVTSPTSWGTDLAEMYVFLVLVPIALDWADRSILEPDQPQRLGRLVGWTVLIVAAPSFFALVRPELPYENLLEETLRYLSRPTEAFLAVLLLHVFFSYGRHLWSQPHQASAPAPAMR